MHSAEDRAQIAVSHRRLVEQDWLSTTMTEAQIKSAQFRIESLKKGIPKRPQRGRRR